MGTRGFITFVVDDEEKTAYNHWDSYPGGLGLTMLEWLREATKDPAALRQSAAALRVVSPDSTPSEEDIVRLARFGDTSVATGSLRDWYVLLRQAQGQPGLMLEAGVIEDARGFPLDSLFAEWGYVIDLDGDGLFEVYRGFQKQPHDLGRFAARGKPGGDRGYYPCARVARWPLAALPGNDEFLAQLKQGDEDDEG
jgi:hypothetical protein